MKYIISIIGNSLGIPIAIAAICYESEPAGNIIKFTSGFTAIASVLLVAMIALTGSTPETSDRPPWYKASAIAINIIVTAILVCGGWFWCATAMAMRIVATAVVFSIGDRKEEL